jgi:hypothetical protein
MAKTRFKKEDGFGRRSVGKLFILLVAMSLLGCVAAIPAIIYYEQEHKGFAVTVQLDVEANKVYQTALDLIEHPPETEVLPGFIKVTNIKKDDKKLSVTFDAIFKDGTHHDKVKVTAIGTNRSQLIAVADTPGKKEANQTSALQIVKAVCDKLGVKYKLVKG